MAQIPNLQSTNTLGVDDQAILRQGTIDKRIGLNLAGILSWARRNGYAHLGEHTTGIQFPDTGSFTTFQGKTYFVKAGVTLPYSSVSNDPSTDNNLYSKGEDSLKEEIYSALGNINLLSNPNFLTPSSLSVDDTPQDVSAGVEIFSGVFAGTSGIQGLTIIDGRVSFSGGDFYMTVPNTGAISRLTASQLTASVADFAGKPRTRGVSFSLVGNEYRVTVGVDALEAASGNVTPLGSVKFEQGIVATKHEVAGWNQIKQWRDDGNVLGWGAVGDGVTDDTDAMQAAHSTGKLIFYPRGKYKFTRISMDTGGIIGEGKDTILSTTDTSTNNVITHNLKDPDVVLVNERGFIFRDFSLRADTNLPTQKTAGAGIYAAATAPENENYTSLISNVTIRNIPESVHTSLVSFLTIRDCYFAFYTINGVYQDMNNETFEDNGDNGIINNTFFTNGGSAFGIKYRCGGGRICNNKINGGVVGIDISPLRSSSVITVTGNSIENQGVNCIRFIVEGDSNATAFGRMSFTGNQLNAAVSTGSAMSLISTGFITREIAISGNQIQHNAVGASVDLRGIERFCVTGNEIYGNNVATSGVYVESDCDDGYIGNNQISGINGRNLQNNSIGTINADQMINSVVDSISLPSLNSGDSYQHATAISWAELGDQAIVAIQDASTAGLLITAQVYATGAIIIEFQNNSASPISLGTITAKIIVKSV